MMRAAAVSGGDAVDDDEVGIGIFLPNELCCLIFRALIAGRRGGPVLELDDDVAFAGGAFHALIGAAAHDEIGAEFCEGGSGGGEVFGISLLVADRDAHNPVGFRHGGSLCVGRCCDGRAITPVGGLYAACSIP